MKFATYILSMFFLWDDRFFGGFIYYIFTLVYLLCRNDYSCARSDKVTCICLQHSSRFYLVNMATENIIPHTAS